MDMIANTTLANEASIQEIMAKIEAQDHAIRQIGDTLGVIRACLCIPAAASAGGIAGSASQQSTPSGSGVRMGTPQAPPRRVNENVSAHPRRRELGF